MKNKKSISGSNSWTLVVLMLLAGFVNVQAHAMGKAVVRELPSDCRIVFPDGQYTYPGNDIVGNELRKKGFIEDANAQFVVIYNVQHHSIRTNLFGNEIDNCSARVYAIKKLPDGELTTILSEADASYSYNWPPVPAWGFLSDCARLAVKKAAEKFPSCDVYSAK